ncbi:hypothetical protein JM18_005589 [Phytophthora kernoviae]|uniref:Uncharacterized protein n=2 Tax=Phytophthora kernoviae TaxID=325452 RepID=A0A8T0LXI7_9STRA|nr:hypothetical protein G195_007527 [Phytophthora kernoviae 00238/432]KAG2522304.1 hypothetical protein JM16_005795 [Phytophthora kernoviae]KAG2523926.1 hypothetical protein JM18_005589 [Phytophthora kernoviae]
MPMLYPTDDKNMQNEMYPRMTLSDDSSENGIMSSTGVSGRNVMEKYRPAQVPMVFCTGVVPGTIEDAALGFFADTEERSRMRNSNNKDAVVDDMRILARIQGPTKDDPFRFLGVKWCAHSTSGAAGCFIKSRDYLIIESTGMALDLDGNRFTYMLNHSIELDEVPDFRKNGHVRIAFSICYVLRPHGVGEIDIFCQGFVDIGGKIPKRLSTYMFCDGLMIVPQFVEDAYAKKLTWLLRTQHFDNIVTYRELKDTDDRSRMRHNTNKDVLVDDIRMLTQIHGPTNEDPFQFLGIKWCSHIPSRTVSFVVKPRDYVVFESTGMAIDPNGQRFSYMLNHSLEIDEVPDYRDFGQVRIAFSICYIFRQREIDDKADTVDMFARGFMDAGGRFTVRIATSHNTFEAEASAARVIVAAVAARDL